MLKLYKNDLRRIYKDVLFKVACIVGLAFGIITPLLNLGLQAMMTGLFGDFGEDFVTAKSVFFSSMTPGGDFGFILPILLVIVLCKDFGQGTVRNKLISGKSRSSVFLSFFLTAATYLCGFMLSVGVLSLGISLIFFDYQATSFTASDFGYLIISVLLYVIVYVFIAALISLLCVVMKNAGLALVVYLALNFVLALVGGVVSIAASFIEKPETFSDKMLIFFKNVNPFATVIGSGDAYTLTEVLQIALVPIVLGALFVYLGILAFRKKDLK